MKNYVKIGQLSISSCVLVVKKLRFHTAAFNDEFVAFIISINTYFSMKEMRVVITLPQVYQKTNYDSLKFKLFGAYILSFCLLCNSLLTWYSVTSK